MGLDSPVGNVVINTKRGGNFRIDERDLNDFILPNSTVYSADEERKYHVNGRNISVGQYTDILKSLSSLKI